MNKHSIFAKLAISTSIIAATFGINAPVYAQNSDEPEAEEFEGPAIIVTGTRRTDRTIADSVVPIDVISSEALLNSGSAETNRLLNNLVPSFNFPQPSLTDGTDSLRPATLRGLSPDQVLVLVNGKRRHLSSLLNLNGSVGRGSAGVDLNTIPAIAIERIEVLRDGASSLYGSDAIAGVINVQLKRSVGGRAQASYGKYITQLEGVAQVDTVAATLTGNVNENPAITFTGEDRRQNDGDTYTLASNIGLPVGPNGYLNLTAEYRDRSPTNRSGPDLRRQFSGLGDIRETTFDRYSHRFGDGQSQDFNLFLNAGYDLADNIEIYSFASFGVRDGNGAGFYRRSLDSRNIDFANGGQPFVPEGFLPIINSEIIDISAAAGLRGEAGGWDYDLSLVYGGNTLNYRISDSFNTSLGGLASNRSFDAGGLRSGQTAINLDLRRDISLGLATPISFAIGAEYRDERYEIVAGEEQSFIAGPFAFTNGAPPGSQVFPGFSPITATRQSRDSFAGYVEFDADLTNAFNVQIAGRYENFSDFGSTTNGKIAARYEVIDGFAFRGSVSTGFRAPGLAQQFFSTTSTNNVGGQLIEVGTFPVDSPIARALGSEDLEAEKSLNFGGGATLSLGRFNLTVDYYNIKINDRITLTENLTGADVVAVLNAAGVVGTSARFFINGIDTRSQGVDIVAGYTLPEFGLGRIRLNAGFNINETDITDRRTFTAGTGANAITLGEGRLFARQESLRLTDGQPSNKLNLGLNWEKSIFGLTANANRFGEVFLPDAVTTATVNGLASSINNPQIRNDINVAAGDAPGDLDLTPKWVVDLELRVSPIPSTTIAIGANNLLDEYPDRLPFGVVNGVNFGTNNSFLPYSSQSPFGFSGRFLYARVSIDF